MATTTVGTKNEGSGSGAGQYAVLAGTFVSASASVDFDAGAGPGAAGLLVCADEDCNFYSITKGARGTYLEKFVGGKWTHLTRHKPATFPDNRGESLSLSLADGHLTGRAGTLVLTSTDNTHRSGRVAGQLEFAYRKRQECRLPLAGYSGPATPDPHGGIMPTHSFGGMGIQKRSGVPHFPGSWHN